MSQSQESFLRTNQDCLEEYRISTVRDIASPNAIPEIKAPEDLHAILPHLEALDSNNPIFVPGYRWEGLHTQPAFSQYGTKMRELMSKPLIYYEPPELFRYKMPGRLKTYALQGSRSRARRFNKALRSGDIDGAIDTLPEFFQPFMEAQRESLISRDDDAGPVPDSLEDSDRKVTEAWRDPRADQGFLDYFQDIVENAKDAANAHVVAPVPPVLKSSDRNVMRRVRGANRAMAQACEGTQFGFGNPIYSYYHIYTDYNILRSGSSAGSWIYEALQEDLSASDYAGIVLTITGYKKAWGNHMEGAMADFISDVSSIAKRHEMPLLLPRSNWYGARLTDKGAHGFSFLMNGKERYHAKSGGMSDRKHVYGKTPTYGHAVNLDLDQLDNYLKQNSGQVTQITGLPSQPPVYNPNGSTPEQRFGKPREFRISFGKPRRLLHAEEARELRDELVRGTLEPAKHYFARSQHPLLS